MPGKNRYYWLLLLVPALFLAWYFLAASSGRPMRQLPTFAPKFRHAGDTATHRVRDFRFVNQDGDTISQDFFANKIYVAEFFFTTCQSICPVMNNNLQRVYAHFEKDTDLVLLSHTVDPETDSVPVLKQYAAMMGVNDRRWQFVTGDKAGLYSMARKAYLLDDGKDAESPDFVHTQNFALVDHTKRIRGFYDGTDSLEINRMIRDIETLLEEKRYHEKTGA